MRAIARMLLYMLIAVVVLVTSGSFAQSTNVPDFVPGSWSLVVLPDTQNYSASYPELFKDQTLWIVANKDRYNIKYVLHEGDIVNNNAWNEWSNAVSAMSILDGVMPYAIVPGNHDSTNSFTSYFPATNFMTWPTFGGLMDSNTLDNSYHLFSAGGADWVILALEYQPGSNIVAWANQVANNYPARRKILLTHYYLNTDGTRGPSGEMLWQTLVNVQPNFTMVTGGHFWIPGPAYLASTNQFGDVVHQMIVDYQGGNEPYLRILEFRPDGKTVQVKAYSPYHGIYLTDSANQFQFILDPPLPPLLAVSNDGGASNITTVAATLNGQFDAALPTVVSVYWGTADIGTNSVGWDHVVDFGQCSTGLVSTNITGLIEGATYYYRFCASNSAAVAWADPAAQFTTASTPSIDNDIGATSLTPTSARLTGNFTGGSVATVTVYWGTTDGGTTPSSWQNTNNLGTFSEGAFLCDISELNVSSTYYYRSYAINVAGSAWANSTASFQTPASLAAGSACKMKITFAGYNPPVAGQTLTNFPALMVLGTNIANFTYSQFQSPNGWDLRFAPSDESTNLNYEIERWNTNGSSLVWVQVPTISSSSDFIWAYWGNGATQEQAYTTNGSTWDKQFRGVWHLDEIASAFLCDATSNRLTGAQGGNASANGVIGGGQYLNGNSRMDITNGASPALDMGNNFTFSGWFAFDGTSVNLNRLVGRKAIWNDATGWDIGLVNDNSLFMRCGSAVTAANFVPSWTSHAWYYVAVAVNGTSVTFYRDGVLQTSGTLTATVDNDLSLTFGYDPHHDDGSWNGKMDEARIQQGAASANWIWASYMTMASNSLFSSYQIQSGSTSTATTVHGIPYTWLASYGITNTSDSVETQHMNGHSFNVLQDYIAGMNPTNPNSCFLVGITNATGQIVVRIPSIQATGPNYAPKSRYYDIEQCINLLTGSWQPIPNYTNIPANGNLITCTNAPQNAAAFYRAKARLQ
jgi:hypothetical protein